MLWEHDFSPDDFPEGLDFFIRVKIDIESTVSPFAASDFQFSVDVTEDRSLVYIPLPHENECLNHWGQGLMDFVDEHWEYTTALPRLTVLAPRAMAKRERCCGGCDRCLRIHSRR